MSSIDELHFEVILGHSQFDKEAKAVEDTARRLNTSVSNILDLTKKVKGAEGEVAGAIERSARAQDDFTASAKGTNSTLNTTKSIMQTLAQLTGVAFSVATIRRFASSLVEITGQFEVQKMALTSMLQSAEVADDIFNRLRKNALASPYTFADLTKFAKQLTAFNIPVDQLVETEKRLADVAAGLGVDMGRIILAYGQVKAAGALKGQELRQFTEAGVPILEDLAKQIEETEGKAISLSEVFSRVSKKQIPFEMVEESFRRMTSAGGKFYNMQEVLVETLQGKIGKLRDVWQQTLYDLGTSQSKFLKGSVDTITYLVQNLDKLGRILPELIAAWGAYRATLILVEVATSTFDLANHKVLTSLANIGKWIKSNPYAILAAAIVAAGIAIKKFYDDAHAGQKRLNDALRNNDRALNEELEKLEELNTKLKVNKKHTEEWEEARAEIVKNYGKYLNGLDNEIEKVGYLGDAYDTLVASVKESIRLRQFSDFEQSERDFMNNAMGADMEALRKKVYKNYSRADAYLIMKAVEDEIRKGSTYASDETPLWSLLMSKGGNGALTNVAGKMRSVINNAARLREDYINNVRTLVQEYGLQGTELDPDFNGPMPKAGGKPKKKTTPITWGNDWNPLGADEAEQARKAAEEAEKAIEAYEQALERFGAKNTEVEGVGALYKITKALSDYKTAIHQTAEEFRGAADKAGKAYGPTKRFDDEIEKLLAISNGRDEASRAKLRNSINNAASAVFKEEMSGYDLTNWNDKTLAQIKTIGEALDNVQVPDQIKEALADDEELLKLLEEALKKIVKDTQENTLKPEYIKKQSDAFRTIAGAVNDVAKAATDLAEATGDKGLAGAMTDLQEGLSTMASAAASFMANDMIGGITSLITFYTTNILKALTEATALKTTIREAAAESRAAGFSKALSDGTSSIFGEDSLRSVKNATANLKELKSLTNGNLGKNLTDKMATTTMPKWWEFFLAPTATAAWIKLFSGLANMDSIEGMADKLGRDLYDEYGNLNAETLQAILDTYENLSEADREWIENAITNSEAYAEALKQVDEAMEQLFGQVADDMVDTFIDNFKEMGDAVNDFGDTFTNLGETILRSLLKSYILENILNKYKTAANNAMMAYASGGMSGDEYAQWLDQFTANVEQDAKNQSAAINGLISAFYDRGLIDQTGDESNSLGAGIKGITEDTANLLASYINAIRADVSVMRGLQEKGWLNVEALVGVITPSLAEYVQQIAANTYDAAQKTAQILTELQSVIGSPGSAGMVVRVETA